MDIHKIKGPAAPGGVKKTEVSSNGQNDTQINAQIKPAEVQLKPINDSGLNSQKAIAEAGKIFDLDPFAKKVKSEAEGGEDGITSDGASAADTE